MEDSLELTISNAIDDPEQALAEWESLCHPAAYEDSESVLKHLASYCAIGKNTSTEELRGKIKLMARELDHPIWAIQQAARQWIRTNQFFPTFFEFNKLCAEHAVRWKGLGRDLKSKILQEISSPIGENMPSATHVAKSNELS